ncbi:MAG: hypothetical protein LBQ81_03180 [Zoogloeaceae bacterium]|jgi:hypothetical protein|nr:hypothetical protein [Zoogloeaceae bacterium]
MPRFFVLCAVFLAVLLSTPAAHAGRNTELPQFKDEVIVAADTPDAAQKPMTPSSKPRRFANGRCSMKRPPSSV